MLLNLIVGYTGLAVGELPWEHMNSEEYCHVNNKQYLQHCIRSCMNVSELEMSKRWTKLKHIPYVRTYVLYVHVCTVFTRGFGGVEGLVE